MMADSRENYRMSGVSSESPFLEEIIWEGGDNPSLESPTEAFDPTSPLAGSLP